LLRGGSGCTPPVFHAQGNLALLRQPLTALFCSTKCPGEVILRAFDQVAQLRDAGRAVISGFHTPVEQECLTILLRGTSPIVICPARCLARYRVPSAWKPALTANRLLVLSPFADGQTRATADLAHRRNEFVAALASEVRVFHATPGGRLAMLIEQPAIASRLSSEIECPFAKRGQGRDRQG
jgi:predicted Rossmann fold nucleotide-binding protein DprA/Smf involved in DNA uptake